jgi:NAD(P)-dependent dehydrogenase (short-subunit alcohol dehydrogenase family)
MMKPDSLFDFSGKVVLVTGGPRGLGYQMVKSHAARGAYAELGQTDILVNNAGMPPPCPSHEISESLFNSVINPNFKAPFPLASQIGHRMAQGSGGSSST